MKATFPFVGQIGTTKEADGSITQGIELINIVSFIQTLKENVTEIQLDIASPGGLVGTADAIYNYLLTLKPKYKITMNQVGDVCSAATKIWFAGDERIATEGYSFMIHNVWGTHTGDAKAMNDAAAELKAKEQELCNFYVAATGLPITAIQPLMDAETYINTTQAIDLKFATKTQSNFSNMINLKELFNKWKKPANDLKNLVVATDDGTSIFIDAPDTVTDPSQLVGAGVYEVDASGNKSNTPVKDGKYKFGNITLTVAAGKVITVDNAPTQPTPAPAPQASLTPDAFKSLIDTALADNNKSLEDKINASIDAKLKELKSNIGGTHRPPTAQRTGVDPSQTHESPIDAYNRRAREKENSKKP